MADGRGEAGSGKAASGRADSGQAAGLLRVRRFPELTVATPRLHVRALVADDAADVAGLFADRQAQRWLASPAGCAGLPEALAWCTELRQERRDSGAGDHYAVVRREDDGLVGCAWTKRTDWAALATEVCFAVCEPARGFGFAAEALDALSVALILEHGFQRIELRIAPGNTAARRVGEKAGFVYEGLLRNAGHLHSGRVDLELWSLVAADLR
ncbi:MAG: GNAT family N-acetyltransferase [Micromonosporaceae bacterium]|nr:GNAT family N-acetyltransferase [Micromonosporaceae bacterium]